MNMVAELFNREQFRPVTRKKIKLTVKGIPLDPIDAVCQQLFFGYQCLNYDYENCDSSQPIHFTYGPDGKPDCSKYLMNIN